MLRGTTLIHLSLTAQALTSAGCVHQKHPILRRDDGRSRRSLKGKNRSTAQLQDHVRRGLLCPFAASRALCAISPRLLFSSLLLDQ